MAFRCLLWRLTVAVRYTHVTVAPRVNKVFDNKMASFNQVALQDKVRSFASPESMCSTASSFAKQRKPVPALPTLPLPALSLHRTRSMLMLELPQLSELTGELTRSRTALAASAQELEAARTANALLETSISNHIEEEAMVSRATTGSPGLQHVDARLL
jgi:hypothetical protein